MSDNIQKIKNPYKSFFRLFKINEDSLNEEFVDFFQ